jgi:hypothetical protein
MGIEPLFCDISLTGVGPGAAQLREAASATGWRQAFETFSEPRKPADGLSRNTSPFAFFPRTFVRQAMRDRVSLGHEMGISG